MHLRLDQQRGKENRICLCLRERWVFQSVLVCVAGHTYRCMHSMCVRARTPFGKTNSALLLSVPEAWSCGSLTSEGLLNSATPNRCPCSAFCDSAMPFPVSIPQSGPGLTMSFNMYITLSKWTVEFSTILLLNPGLWSSQCSVGISIWNTSLYSPWRMISTFRKQFSWPILNVFFSWWITA